MKEKRTVAGLIRRAQRRSVWKRSEIGKASSAAWYQEHKDAVNAAARKKYAENAEFRASLLAKQRARDAARRPLKQSRPPRKSNALRQREYKNRHPERTRVQRSSNGARITTKTLKRWRRAAHHRGMQNPEFVVVKRLRTRLNDEVRFRARKTIKFTSAMNLVGCTRAELVKHIEAQFKPGMTWGNRSDWQIDHIRPVSSFDMLDLEQQKLCFHFTNLQPLWRAENARKGHKIIPFEVAA